MSAGDQLKPGQQIGGYEIIRPVGRGGMGEVYEAYDNQLRRRVAIKILSNESLDNPDMVERFRIEGLALAKLKHPNVVTLYGTGEFEGRKFMAMEFIDGKPLDHYLMSHPCGLSDVVDLFRQMAEGLAAAHEAGVIHRDIKPSNIVVDKGMQAKIVDFGISKVRSEISSVTTTQNMVIGTVNFLAPEVVVGRPATQVSDMYSLGLVFFTVLTGDVPYNGKTNLEILEKIRSNALAFPPRVQALVPESLREIILRMTHKTPKMRYTSVREVIQDLQRVSLNSWPQDLRRSCKDLDPVINYTEVRKVCEGQGFELGEFHFVLAIAARIQAEDHDEPRARIRDQERPTIRVTEWAIGEAITRFQTARNELMRKPTSETKTAGHERKTKKRKVKPFRIKWRLFVDWRAFASYFITFVVMATIYWWISLKISARSAPEVPRQTASVHETEGQTPEPTSDFSFDLKPCLTGETITLRRTLPGHPPQVRTYRKVVGEYQQPIWRVNDDHFEIWSINPFLPPLKVSHGKKVSRTHLLSEGSNIFPLEINKSTWYRLKDSHSEFTYFCQTMQRMRLRVSAGTHDVVRVDCMRSNMQKREGVTEGARDIYYFAPDLHHWILHEQVPTGLREEWLSHNIRRKP